MERAMSETGRTCPIAICEEDRPHEHRGIYDDRRQVEWYELQREDLLLLNRARLDAGLPVLVFGSASRASVPPRRKRVYRPKDALMDETFACGEPGCRATDRHVHRQCSFDIRSGIAWHELAAGDVTLLNEARAAHGLPRVVFASPGP